MSSFARCAFAIHQYHFSPIWLQFLKNNGVWLKRDNLAFGAGDGCHERAILSDVGPYIDSKFTGGQQARYGFGHNHVKNSMPDDIAPDVIFQMN